MFVTVSYKLLQVYTFLNLFIPTLFTVVVPLSHLSPQDGWTALMLASDSGHTDVVQLLLSSGAKIDMQNKVRHSIML